MSLSSIFNLSFKSNCSSSQIPSDETVSSNISSYDDDKVEVASTVTGNCKSYMVYEDFDLYLSQADTLISYIEQTAQISLKSPPFNSLIESFIKLVGPLPSVDGNDSIFIHSLKLFRFMSIVAKDNTYLFSDYKKECVLVCLLTIAFIHELCNLTFYKIDGIPGGKHFFVTDQTLEEFVGSNNVRALLVEQISTSISFENSFAIGQLVFSKQVQSVFNYLKENDSYDLALRLLLYKANDPLYKVFLKSHDLTLDRIEHHINELFESLRPSFEGIKNTPANWYELESFQNLTPVYDEDRLALIDIHAQVDMAYCLSRKWAIDLFNLQKKVNEQLKTTIELNERLQKKEKPDPFNEKREKLKKAFVDSITTDNSIKEDKKQKDLLSIIPPLLETIENSSTQKYIDDINIDDRLTDSVIEEKILESNTSDSLALENALNDVIFSPQAINNRYCFENQINSITAVSTQDDRDIKAFKTVIKNLTDVATSNSEIQKELDKRIKRFKQVLDVILSFVKDGSFKIDYDLENVLKNAASFNDLFTTVLSTYHASMNNYEVNKVGISYLNKFVKAEVKRFSSL